MSVLKFYPLAVKDITPETDECVSVAFEVPASLNELFQFIPGQYLTIRKQIGGEDVRRSYSVCAGLQDKELRVAVKRMEKGKFSGYLHEQLKVGDILDVMPPNGNFISKLTDKTKKHYLAIAAGSGITPVMSIMKSVLHSEPQSQFTLVYGNRDHNSIIFHEAIEALKNTYMTRLSVYHILTREQQEVPLFNGRITAEKIHSLCHKLIDIHHMDEIFICGPEDMLLSVRAQLLDMQVPSEKVHIELFTSPDQPHPKHDNWVKEHQAENNKTSKVSVTVDGMTTEIELSYNGDSILEAALKQGADLPYACKGGVCSTCRAKVLEGEVVMETNYALEKEEVEKGYILTCQSHPVSERVVVDFDAR